MKQLKGKYLLIRVDASTEIGTGHLMRCLALAQAWKDAGNKATFITNCQSEGLLQRLRDEEFSLHVLAHSHPDPSDWDYTKDILASYPNAWVVLDGYHFDEVYQQGVKEAGHPLLVIDDMGHLKHYYADVVLNQNLSAEKLHYSTEPYTRLLLGTRYVPLRREFLAWRGWKREIPEVAQRVLVTLGGSDLENHTLKVVQALQKVDVTGVEAIVAIGASNPHADELEVAASQSRIPIRLIRNAQNMPELMAWADVAITGGGLTKYETAVTGTPSIIISQDSYQADLSTKFAKEGSAVYLGSANEINGNGIVEAVEELLRDDTLRAEMSKRGKGLVDGKGIEQIISEIPQEVLL